MFPHVCVAFRENVFVSLIVSARGPKAKLFAIIRRALTPNLPWPSVPQQLHLQAWFGCTVLHLIRSTTYLSANAMQDLIVMMHNSLMSRKLHLQAGFGCTCLKSQLTLSEFNAGLGDDVPHRDVPTAAAVTGRLRVPTHSSRCLRSQLDSR